MILLTPESYCRDEGSIIIFGGEDPDFGYVLFACDRRPALDIIEALQSGEQSGIYVDVQDWQVVG